mmetsp:Transcript_15968/g.43794  ORF Transcript_15968/g.43794 Transcript_15968/m.43794 type:complete len:215 (-) Transcript_15968:278-922(-)
MFVDALDVGLLCVDDLAVRRPMPPQSHEPAGGHHHERRGAAGFNEVPDLLPLGSMAPGQCDPPSVFQPVPNSSAILRVLAPKKVKPPPVRRNRRRVVCTRRPRRVSALALYSPPKVLCGHHSDLRERAAMLRPTATYPDFRAPHHDRRRLDTLERRLCRHPSPWHSGHGVVSPHVGEHNGRLVVLATAEEHPNSVIGHRHHRMAPAPGPRHTLR